MHQWLWPLALFLLPSLAGANDVAAEKLLAEKGRAIYNFRCYFCHGYSGDAKTLASTYLSPPPANFRATGSASLSLTRIVETLKHGRPGTAMKPFNSVLNEGEMVAVATFVLDEFVRKKAENTKYHTVENGWPNHDKFRIAFPFATGEIPLSRPWESLSSEESNGKRLYLSTCVSCHDRGAPGLPGDDDPAWDSRPLSYPRNHFSLASPPKPDAMTSASPYALHDLPPKLTRMSKIERRGERLFQNNCAFCHGADGTGKNWIGQFLEPHPRNLQDPAFMSSASRETLSHAIAEGLPGTSMPAWKDVLGTKDIQAILAYISRAFYPLKESPSSNKTKNGE